jgi:hypothetical protein
MNQNYSDVRATAQTKLNREYADGATPVPEGRIREVVEETIVFLGASDVDTRALVAELEAIFKTIIGSERALVGYDDGWSPWLAKRRADIPWRFWDRYRHYLQRGQGWPLATVERLDQATDRVLDYLTNPVAPGAWDRRGMVVGHVQSGKTANYVGLVCKAADAGYKIIIVLAGFHKSLRSQTQIRLEEGFLGYDRGATLQDPSGRRATVGVGDTHLYDPAPAADSITTRADDGDFKRALAKNFAIHPGGNPLLFVVKKNASVLRNLLEWVRWVAQSKDEKGRKYIKGVPLIVIDDEADQGSIDTRKGAFDEEGNVDEDHDPTVLNARIRELLYLFDQSAYIGYTATPFANILIHEQGRTDGQGDDLFPRSFIISLPTASNYVGPSRIFGFSGPDQEPVEPLPIVREVSDHAASLALREDSGWIPPRHNKDWIPKHDGLARVPPSLQRAIRSFVLACAARLARRDASAHNTMLVHVTRFTAVQHRVAEQVNEELLDIQRRLRYGDGDSSITIRSALRTLWEEDFEPTHATIRGMGLGLDCLEHPWTELEPLVERAALSIVVREINGGGRRGPRLHLPPGERPERNRHRRRQALARAHARGPVRELLPACVTHVRHADADGPMVRLQAALSRPLPPVHHGGDGRLVQPYRGSERGAAGRLQSDGDERGHASGLRASRPVSFPDGRHVCSKDAEWDRHRCYIRWRYQRDHQLLAHALASGTELGCGARPSGGGRGSRRHPSTAAAPHPRHWRSEGRGTVVVE